MLEHKFELALALGVVAPFVSFWLLVFFGPRLGKPKAGWFAVILGMGVPLALATYVLIGWLGLSPAERLDLSNNVFQWTWANLGDVPLVLSVKLDSLTVAMYFMVTFIAFWIFVFSVGYMAGHSDEVAGKSKYHRFFAYLSLFGFSMLGLVISSSLMFLFIFWELVGLCSYLLIGYYFDTVVAQRAQMKAFIVNRVGDFGFLIGLMLVFFYLGTLDLSEAAAAFASQHAAGTGIFASQYTLLGLALPTLMGIGLFCGAMGKSAQFPLHVWLPDAMAGPTPVSALIHAATMVAAGVYLVARVFPLMTPDALMFIAGIGCITLTLMALIAIVQTDIKKCLAYSTLSQLGYMIFGMGCGAWVAALFHLITHAFFKAMMFLGSGQVIEGCHHEQDMRKMGGLIKKMPFTAVTFLVGVLAIAGTGIPGTKIGLGGFLSKDEILAVSYARAFEWGNPADYVDDGAHEGHGDGHAARENLSASPAARLAADRVAMSDEQPHGGAGHHNPADHHAAGHGDKPASQQPAAIMAGTRPLPKWMFYLALATAYITPFYMMRCWWMTFMGKPRDKHVYEHAHESKLMYIPLVVLAVGTFVATYWIFRDLIAGAASKATDAAAVMAIDGTSHAPAIHHAHEFLKFGVGFAFVIGFAVAIAIYRNGLDLAERIRKIFFVAPIHRLLEKKYFFDELYDFLWVRGCLLVAGISRFFDTYVVDLLVNLSAALTERIAALSGNVLDKHGIDGFYNGVADVSLDVSDTLRAPQTGRIRNYVLFAAAAATAVVVGVLWVGLTPESAAAATP